MSKITLSDSLANLQESQLARLHVGWPKPPAPKTFLQSLRNMNAVVLAVDEDTGTVVGFVCGLTDRMLILFIWDLEVLPEYQGQGLEKQLLQRLLDKHGDIYQVEAPPQKRHQALFEELGLKAYGPEHGPAMTRMHLDWQDGGPRAAR